MELESLKSKLQEQSEEVDYYKTKVDKIDAELISLKTSKNDNKRIRDLESEL